MLNPLQKILLIKQRVLDLILAQHFNVQKISFLSIFIIFLSWSNSTYAENDILFIDLDYIFTNSNAGKKITKEIQEKNKNINNQFNDYQKLVSEKRNNLLNQKKILSEEEFKKKLRTLENEINEMNKKISTKKKEIINLQQKIRSQFSKELKILLQNYAQNNSINMIVNKNNILIGKKDLDITKEILDLFNKKIKTIKVE